MRPSPPILLAPCACPNHGVGTHARTHARTTTQPHARTHNRNCGIRGTVGDGGACRRSETRPEATARPNQPHASVAVYPRNAMAESCFDRQSTMAWAGGARYCGDVAWAGGARYCGDVDAETGAVTRNIVAVPVWDDKDIVIGVLQVQCCVRACMHVCVRASERACLLACVRACVHTFMCACVRWMVVP